VALIGASQEMRYTMMRKWALTLFVLPLLSPAVAQPLAILARDDAESIVLNLMQPQAAGRQRVGFGWKARRNEAGREGAHTQHNAHS